MSLLKFNGNVPTWNIETLSDISNENRIKKYKNVINELSNIKLCEIEAIERIGSDSSAGEVYKYKNLNESIAVKILPIINTRSEVINNNEINLAKKVSNLVLENKSKYFPLVYYDLFCESTFYYEHSTSKFAIQSLNYQQYIYVRNSLTKSEDLVKELDKIYKSGKNLTEIFKSIDIDKELNHLKISSQLLFSELAYTDLKNFLTKKVSKELLNQIITQVFEGIKDLQNLANIVHNDLHLGNVLLLYKPDENSSSKDSSSKDSMNINILIHDFGRSKICEKLSNIQGKTDILTFINEIKKYVNTYLDGDIYEYFNNKIQDVIEILDTSESPIEDVLKYF